MLLTLIIAGVAAAANEEAVNLSYFVEHEVELDRDFLEIVVEAKAEDSSLKTTLAEASATVAFIRDEVHKFCLANSQKKGECEEVSECGKFNVEPEYRTIRGEPVFIGTERLT